MATQSFADPHARICLLNRPLLTTFAALIALYQHRRAAAGGLNDFGVERTVAPMSTA